MKRSKKELKWSRKEIVKLAKDSGVPVEFAREMFVELVKQQKDDPDPDISGMWKNFTWEGEEPTAEEVYLWMMERFRAAEVLNDPARMKECRVPVKHTEEEMAFGKEAVRILTEGYGITREELHARLLDTLLEGLEDPDPLNRMLWSAFTFEGKEPTAEELILWMAGVQSAQDLMEQPKGRKLLRKMFAG